MVEVHPGWYRDPDGSANLRWWDGQRWTENRCAPLAARPTALAPLRKNWVLVSVFAVVVACVVALAVHIHQNNTQWYKLGYDKGPLVHSLVNAGMDARAACKNLVDMESGFGVDEQRSQDVSEHSSEIERGCQDHLRDYYGEMLPSERPT